MTASQSTISTSRVRTHHLPRIHQAHHLVCGTQTSSPDRRNDRKFAGSIPYLYCIMYCRAQHPSSRLSLIEQPVPLGPFKLLGLIMLLYDLLFKASTIVNALPPLYSFDIFRELALRFTSPPDGQVAFENVIDLLQGTSSGFGVCEEDVESHRCA